MTCKHDQMVDKSITPIYSTFCWTENAETVPITTIWDYNYKQRTTENVLCPRRDSYLRSPFLED